MSIIKKNKNLLKVENEGSLIKVRCFIFTFVSNEDDADEEEKIDDDDEGECSEKENCSKNPYKDICLKRKKEIEKDEDKTFGFLYKNLEGSNDLFFPETLENYFKETIDPLIEEVGLHKLSGTSGGYEEDNKKIEFEAFELGSFEIKEDLYNYTMTKHREAFVKLFGVENVGQIIEFPKELSNCLDNEDQIKYIYITNKI
jgi:hypothetical protein